MTSNLPNSTDVIMSELEALSKSWEFSAILRGSIAEGMKSVLGDDGAQAIIFHLGLPNLDDPRKFHEKLSTIFGFGTMSLERVILQHLYQNMGFQPASMDEGDFVSRVELARRSYETSSKRDKGSRGTTG